MKSNFHRVKNVKLKNTVNKSSYRELDIDCSLDFNFSDWNLGGCLTLSEKGVWCWISNTCIGWIIDDRQSFSQGSFGESCEFSGFLLGIFKGQLSGLFLSFGFVFLVKGQTVELDSIDSNQLVDDLTEISAFAVNFPDCNSESLLGLLSDELDFSVWVLILWVDWQGLGLDVFSVDVVGFEDLSDLVDFLGHVMRSLLGS